MPVFPGDILLIAPPTLYRQDLVLMLQHAWPALDFVVTADASQAPGLLRHRAYQLVVVDGLLPAPPLPRLLEQLRMARPSQQLLLLTGQQVSPFLQHFLHTTRYLTLLPRYSAPEAVLRAIELLQGCAAGSAQPASVVPLAQAGTPPTPFSRRELEVLRLVVADCCNEEIADRLCLSVRTVESHRRALLQKAGSRTCVGLVVQAMREGWIAA